MAANRSRNVIITVFVLCWLTLFHYESLRVFFLQPWAARPLPKVKFLFPPAGWIMFFRVDDDYGHAVVDGSRKGVLRPIDPHAILPTRFIGFDNIQRNVLSSVMARSAQEPFCRYLERKFPGYARFVVSSIYYPHFTTAPYDCRETVAYTCERAGQ